MKRPAGESDAVKSEGEGRGEKEASKLRGGVARGVGPGPANLWPQEKQGRRRSGKNLVV